MFYILTAQFTDPVKIHSDWQTNPAFVKLVLNWHLPRTGGASSRMSVGPNTIEVLQAIAPSDEPVNADPVFY